MNAAPWLLAVPRILFPLVMALMTAAAAGRSNKRAHGNVAVGSRSKSDCRLGETVDPVESESQMSEENKLRNSADRSSKECSRRDIMTIGAVVVTGAAMPCSAVAQPEMSRSDRYKHGLEILKKIGGADFDDPINRLAQVSEDMARFTVEYPYGDVLSRPGMDLRTRQICTISSLIAQGSVQPQLRFHMEGLLNVGGRPQDLIEILYFSTAIVGFPAAIDAIGIVRQMFSDRSISFRPERPATDDGTGRYARGLRAFGDLMQDHAESYISALEEMSPELARWSIEFAYGDIFYRDGLEPKIRHFAIVSMLATVGNRREALRRHLQSAMRTGATSTELIEVLIQISVYAGFPAALNAFSVAAEVLKSPAGANQIDATSAQSKASESREVRLERGLAALAITSGASGEAVIRSFDDLAPDMGRMIVEHSYGDIFSRAGIDAKMRELTACAALAARGSKTTETPLRVHINAALNVGASHAEVVETLLNLLPYCGYPAVQEAVRTASEEFRKREEKTKSR